MSEVSKRLQSSQQALEARQMLDSIQNFVEMCMGKLDFQDGMQQIMLKSASLDGGSAGNAMLQIGRVLQQLPKALWAAVRVFVKALVPLLAVAQKRLMHSASQWDPQA